MSAPSGREEKAMFCLIAGGKRVAGKTLSRFCQGKRRQRSPCEHYPQSVRTGPESMSNSTTAKQTIQRRRRSHWTGSS